MANPNIAALTTINGITTSVIPAVTTPVVLLANAASSANVYRIDLITIANQASSAQTATVSIYTNGAQGQNTAPSSGNTFSLAYQISIPANASLVVSDKTTQFYLNEANSIVVTAGSTSNLVFTTSYEAIY